MTGKGEPPEEHQFKPGESGNPKGRPKGSLNLKTILKKLLAEQDVDGQWANPIAKKLLQKAFNDDDYRAIVEIIDRIEGKAKEHRQNTGEIIVGLGNLTEKELYEFIRKNTSDDEGDSPVSDT